MSWPVVKLGDVAERVDYGLTASAKEDNEGPRFLRITDMQDDAVDWSTVPSCECSEKEFKENELSVGDIVFARTGATTGKSFLIRHLPRPSVFASYLIRVRPTDEVDSKYLAYFFKSPQYWFQITAMAEGAAQPGVNSSKLKELEIPLPPLPEQKRIAAILDKADAIRRKRQQAIQLADDFLRAVFLDMFGDPVTNPKGWEVKPIGDVLKLSSGNGLSAKDMDSSGSYPVYGGNGINGYHSEYMFKEPQLVIGRVGAYCGVVHITQPYSWVTDNALYVKNLDQDVNVHYLAKLLDISNLNQYAGKAAQPLVSGSRIYPLEMIFPPLQEQLKFEDVKVKYLESAKGFDFALLEAEAMFSSLSQKSFRGEL